MKIFFSKTKKFGKTIFLEKVVERERDSSEKLNNSFILEKNINTCLEKWFFCKGRAKAKTASQRLLVLFGLHPENQWAQPGKVARRCRSVRVGVERKRLRTQRQQRQLGFGLLSPPPSPSPPGDLRDRDSTAS